MPINYHHRRRFRPFAHIQIMKTRIFAALLLLAPPLYGQPAPSPGDSGDYEELPELKASEILQEKQLPLSAYIPFG